MQRESSSNDEKVALKTKNTTWMVKTAGLSGIKDGTLAILKVKKHGHKGSPHTRVLCFDYANMCIFWVKSESRQRGITHQESKNIDAMTQSLTTMRTSTTSMPYVAPQASSSQPEVAKTSSVSNFLLMSLDLLNPIFRFDKNNRPRPKQGAFVMLYDIIDVVFGKKTEIMQRFTLRRIKEDLCLSVVTLERTVDLEAPNQQTFDQLREQLFDFYNQYMGFPLMCSNPKSKIEYDVQEYMMLADRLSAKVNSMYKEVENKWHDYMWTDAAEKIVKDYPRLAKNIRLWDVRYGGKDGEVKDSDSDNAVAVAADEEEEQNHANDDDDGAVKPVRVRVDSHNHKKGWAVNVIAVMECLVSRLTGKEEEDTSRGEEILAALKRTVAEVLDDEKKRDREKALEQFFNRTFMITKPDRVEDRLKGFKAFYRNPEILSILKVCNQFVLIPAADLLKRECLGNQHRTRDFKPHGWMIEIEFHPQQLQVHQIKRDLSSSGHFDVQYRLTFTFELPLESLSSVNLSIDALNFSETCPDSVRHDVHTRLMFITRVNKIRTDPRPVFMTQGSSTNIGRSTNRRIIASPNNMALQNMQELVEDVNKFKTPKTPPLALSKAISGSHSETYSNVLITTTEAVAQPRVSVRMLRTPSRSPPAEKRNNDNISQGSREQLQERLQETEVVETTGGQLQESSEHESKLELVEIEKKKEADSDHLLDLDLAQIRKVSQTTVETTGTIPID